MRLFLLLFLLSSPVASQSVPQSSTAHSFDLSPEELGAAFEAATGSEKVVTGLLLADLTSNENGAGPALDVMARLPDLGEITEQAGAQVASYARSVHCVIQIRRGLIDRARPECQQSLQNIDRVEDPLLRSRIYYASAFVAIRSGHLEEALAHSSQAVAEAELSGSQYAQASATNSRGLALAYSGLHRQAIDCFEKVRVLTRNFPDRALVNVLNFNLGLAYMELGELEEATAAFKAGAEWAERTGQPHRVFIAKAHMADAHLRRDLPEAAIGLLEPLLFGTDERRDPDTHAHAWLIYSSAHVAIGQPERALELLDRGFEVIANSNNQMRQGQLKLGRIEALLEAGRAEEALQLATQLVADLRQRTESNELDTALRLLSEIAAEQGRFEIAYSSSLEAQRLEEESRGDRYDLHVSILREANQLDQAERELALLQEQQETLTARAQRNTSLLAGLAAILALLVLAGRLNRSRRQQSLIAGQQRQLSEELEGLVAVRTEALEMEMAERMRGEAKRHELEKQLADADKLRALGQLTGGVAHDFNNLLTVVTSASEMLGDEPDMPEAERQELIAAIRRSADSGRDVNRSLLAYARQQPLKPVVLDLQDYLNRSRKIFEQSLGSEMELEIDAASASVEVDAGQLTTAVINLLLNARDASEGRGTVRIRVHPARDPSPDTVSLEVIDSGCGMSRDQAKRAIEPFYSTKTSTLASGMGLSTVYGFVRQSGGDVRIDTSEGLGTTVRLELPRAKTATTAARDNLRIQKLPRNLDVLLVDDDKEVRGMMLRMLQNLGQQVRVADGGQAGLDMLDERAPDVLVSDVLMPGALNGLDLAHAAQARHPDLPILMVSGYAEAVDLDFPLLAKPFNLRELEDSLLSVLQQESGRARATA